jgi:gas vesicle protein
MSKILSDVMQHPMLAMLFGVFIGLAIGLAIGLVKAFKLRMGNRRRERDLKDKIAELQNHIHRQMEINARGNSAMQEELEELREKNENLRVTVKTLENKPGRAELRQLKIYDQAIRLMYERAPGFSGAWEKALHDAEQIVAESETGVRAFMRRVADKLPLISSETPDRPYLQPKNTDEETEGNNSED